jgi:hypothetical protein
MIMGVSLTSHYRLGVDDEFDVSTSHGDFLLLLQGFLVVVFAVLLTLAFVPPSNFTSP